MNGIILLAAITAGLVLLGVAESVTHRRRLKRIPIRIHVNGTRGKSSVTRLIAAGLREGGVITCAKTTGTLPRMIMHQCDRVSGFPPIWPERRRADTHRAGSGELSGRGVVIECMALQPHLQWLCESRFVRATHGVITNARQDHLDVMGPSEVDVAWALAGMTPRGARRSPRSDGIPRFLSRPLRTVAGSSCRLRTRTSHELLRTSYRTSLMSNMQKTSLWPSACATDIGIDRATALRGMWKAKPDPGAMTDHQIDFFGRRLHFVNGFAANDPESTERIWNMAIERYAGVEKRIAVFNCRR